MHIFFDELGKYLLKSTVYHFIRAAQGNSKNKIG